MNTEWFPWSDLNTSIILTTQTDIETASISVIGKTHIPEKGLKKTAQLTITTHSVLHTISRSKMTLFISLIPILFLTRHT